MSTYAPLLRRPAPSPTATRTRVATPTRKTLDGRLSWLLEKSAEMDGSQAPRVEPPTRDEPAGHDGREAELADTALRNDAGVEDAASRADNRSRSSFPHAATIEAGLGARLPGTWRVDGESCRQRGVPGFTDGLTTIFASRRPSLHVAAHEAVHSLQHAGLTRDRGLGPEGHANAVADALVAGRPAASLLDRSRGRTVPSATRPYTRFYSFADQQLWEGAAGEPGVATRSASGSALGKIAYPARVSDTLETLTNSEGSRHSHVLYATQAIVARGNKILAAQGSGVELVTDASDAIEIGGNRLVAVKPVFGGKESDKPCLARNCNEAAWTIMGPGKPAPAARYRKDQLTSVSAHPDKYQREILADAFGGAADADERYKNAADPDRLDLELGINRHARPEVGEAYVVNPTPDHRSQWRYHWAGVVLAPGRDRVTLENSAGDVVEDPNTDWLFQTYGPAAKPGQTFHDEYAEGGFAGPRSEGSMTMVAHNPDFEHLTTQEVIRRYDEPNQKWGMWPWQELQHRSIRIDISFYQFKGWLAGEEQSVTFTLIGPAGKSRQYESGWWDAKVGVDESWTLPITDVIGSAPGGKVMTALLEQTDGKTLAYFDWGSGEPADPYPYPKTWVENASCRVQLKLVEKRDR
ncbi:hypothetical protein [Nannocystis radixulma]|uniref:DUF4157 domain-containing protein n=1 Tax=Nannocystis radixulma TaxID=2995305 RepID=A0ABT5B873_9BACT|nr:hypothetical protein [Nannocystis radixulma]MDC0670320.1 hypothetical protein [Nannocystis radixulma]